MANDCLDGYGNFLHFPRSGGWFDQNENELYMIKVAHQAKYVFSKGLGELKGNPQALKFIQWTLSNG